VVLTSVGMFLVSVVSECVQGLTPYRKFDGWDIVVIVLSVYW
jgi:hypothetical protein